MQATLHYRAKGKDNSNRSNNHSPMGPYLSPRVVNKLLRLGIEFMVVSFKKKKEKQIFSPNVCDTETIIQHFLERKTNKQTYHCTDRILFGFP